MYPSPEHQQGYPPQGYAPQGYPPPGMYPPPGPMKMPGALITVRILMILAALVGFLFAGIFGLVLAVPEAMEGANEAMSMQGLAPGSASTLFIAALAITGLYGLASMVLAIAMGKRSAGMQWTLVGFQVLMALFCAASLVTGGTGSIVLIAFAALLIGLLLSGKSRAYYKGH